MDWLEMLILAVVQGIAEFLPVSSSGHLVVLAGIMGSIEDVSEVVIILHAGTLGSILLFYFQQIWRLVREDRKVIPLLIVGSIPAGIIGIAIKKTALRDTFEPLLESPLLAGAMLIITGLMLLWIRKHHETEDSINYQKLSYKNALLIGAFQAIAILPGISRSGSTIVAGLLTGLRREAAATFSFLLAIPVIGGAALLEFKDLLDEKTVTTDYSILAVGALVAFIVGLISLYLLNRLLNRGKLHLFAYWCIPLGIAVCIWQTIF